LISGHWKDVWAKNCISLVLGALGCEISIKVSLKHKKLACFLLCWSLIGILVGNLYQAQLTESLIVPIKYDTNLTLAHITYRNYTVLLFADAERKFLEYDCMTFPVCRKLVFDTVMINI